MGRPGYQLSDIIERPHPLELPRFANLSEQPSNRASTDPGRLIPITAWTPLAQDGMLSTSRYRMVDHLIRTHVAEANDRNLRNVRGGPRWVDRSAYKETRELSVRPAMVHLRQALKLPVKKGGDRSLFDHRLEGLLEFAKFLEWVQLNMLHRRVRAWRIQRSFERLPEIQLRLRAELNEYANRQGCNFTVDFSRHLDGKSAGRA